MVVDTGLETAEAKAVNKCNSLHDLAKLFKVEVCLRSLNSSYNKAMMNAAVRFGVFFSLLII